MLSASRQALASLREGLSGTTVGLGTERLTELAGELHAVAGLLDGQFRLRRTLADPTTEAHGRADLAERLFGGKIGADALGVVRSAVSQRWSSAWDLPDTLELLGDDVLFSAAEADGVLDQVEDELFRVERVLSGNGDLAALLDERGVDAARRTTLLDSLIAGKAHPISRALLTHALTSTRKRSLVLAIDDLLEAAASRQERSIARVISAVELTAAQYDRLAAVLSTTYGRRISVRSAIDPAVRGGLIIRVGDEVIDGSVATQLLRARKALAG